MVIKQSLYKWLELGVVKTANSLCNSLIFCLSKKQGQGQGIIQDFCQLKNYLFMDKYSMNESKECTGDNGRPSLFITQSHIWILANASASRVTIYPGLNNSRQRSVSMDNLYNGVTQWPGQFQIPNEDSALIHCQWVCLCWWLTHSHKRSWLSHQNIRAIFGSFK